MKPIWRFSIIGVCVLITTAFFGGTTKPVEARTLDDAQCQQAYQIVKSETDTIGRLVISCITVSYLGIGQDTWVEEDFKVTNPVWRIKDGEKWTDRYIRSIFLPPGNSVSDVWNLKRNTSEYYKGNFGMNAVTGIGGVAITNCQSNAPCA